jgi:hypothetical protein
MSDARKLEQLRTCRDHQLRVARLHRADGQRAMAADCVRRARAYGRAMLALRRGPA